MTRAALLLFALLAAPGPAWGVVSGGDDAPYVPGALLHARVAAEKREVVLQEVFEFTVSVYSRGLTMGREIALRNPETPGLTFFPYVDLGSSREVAGGKDFDVRRFLGRAQAVATGTLTLQPEVRVSVVLPDRSQVREANLRAPAVTVRVRPLPEAGRPEGFGGAVGTFSFRAAASPAVVAAGEPVTLTMEIQGQGNLESVAVPQVPSGDAFRLYEPKVVRREPGTARSPGRLVFEQTVVPRATSLTSLPAVTFSFFDPRRGSYQRLVAGPFPLTVRPAARAPALVVDAGPAGAARKRPALGSEIAPRKGAPRRWEALGPRSRGRAFWLLALQAVPLGVALALFLAVHRREQLARDVVKARRQLAPGAARSRLGAAGQALRDGDAARVHETLWEALAAYFGHRLNLLPGQISRDAVAERLSRAGLAPRDVARLGEIFLVLEQERFARPTGVRGRVSPQERERLARLLEELERLLQTCEELPQ